MYGSSSLMYDGPPIYVATFLTWLSAMYLSTALRVAIEAVPIRIRFTALALAQANMPSFDSVILAAAR